MVNSTQLSTIIIAPKLAAKTIQNRKISEQNRKYQLTNLEINTAKCLLSSKIAKFSSAKFSHYITVYVNCYVQKTLQNDYSAICLSGGLVLLIKLASIFEIDSNEC